MSEVQHTKVFSSDTEWFQWQYQLYLSLLQYFISQQDEHFSDQSISRTIYIAACVMETHMQLSYKYTANVNLQCSLFHLTLALKQHAQFCQRQFIITSRQLNLLLMVETV